MIVDKKNKGVLTLYRLAADVFYRCVDNQVFVYKTDSSKIFIYTNELDSILKLFAKEEYKASPYLDNYFIEFLNSLVDKGILEKPKELIENKNDIESQVKNAVENKLYNVMFELTYRCNEKCRYCYCVVDNNKKELTKEEILNIIDELKAMGVFELTFTGGDPFVRHDSIDIIQYAYKQGFVIDLFTNGNLISDSDLIKLRACHLRSLSVSIYSDNPEKHDEFTTIKGSFEKSIELLKKAKLIGIPINIKTTVLNFNHTEIDKILKLASNIGATVQVSMAISARNNGDLSSKDYDIKSIEEAVEVMKKVGDNIRINSNGESFINTNRENIERVDICGAGRHGLSINPYGEVYPCNSLLIKCGDLRKQSIKEIWESSEELSKIRKYTMDQVEGCENCEHIKYCSFCPGSALLEKGSPLVKYEGACRANIARNMYIKERR